jgi:DNA-binding NarL/FixJ family response regulator
MALKRKIYIVYRGDEVVTHGTKYEIAQKLNIKPQTVLFYTSNVHRSRNNGNNHLEAYFVGVEEYEYRVH